MAENNPSINGSRDQKGNLSLSIFFPCYNEAAAIGPLIHKTIEYIRTLTNDAEIIIVDDGSTDGTSVTSDNLAEQYAIVKVIHHKTNLGYGGALQSGFRAATKELVFYTDGDGQFDVTELSNILPLIAQYDIVSCYRLKRQEGIIRRINAWCWTWLVCRVFNMKIKDIDCAFKLFKRKIFDNIQMCSMGALIDTEILARATKKGYSVTQTGVHHYPRTAGKSTGANPAVILRAFKELFKLRKKIMDES